LQISSILPREVEILFGLFNRRWEKIRFYNSIHNILLLLDQGCLMTRRCRPHPQSLWKNQWLFHAFHLIFTPSNELEVSAAMAATSIAPRLSNPAVQWAILIE